jgi:hypothetical protein
MLAALAGLGLATSVGACANPQADAALYARSALLGMPKDTLLGCAGVPDRSAVSDGTEYMTYTSARLDVRTVGVGGWYGYPYGWGGGAWAPATDTYADTVSCAATFIVRDGRVIGLNYGGASDPGAERLAQCYRIVDNCLALAPPMPQPPN